MIRALIFDFDGLILDTEGPDYRAWQEVFQAHGANLPLEVWTDCIGRSSDWFDPISYMEEQLGRDVDRDAVIEQQRQRHLELVEQQPILPGIEEYLAEARQLGLRIGLASSSSRSWVEGHLGRLALLDRWECIRCWDDVDRAKPDPDLYLAVLEHLGVRAEEAIAFEDSSNGIAAARAAGIFCVAVPHALTEGLDLSGANLRLRSLAEIPLADLLDVVESGAGQMVAHDLPLREPATNGEGSMTQA